MVRFLIRRILSAVLILGVVTSVTYFMFFALPSDPAAMSCGQVCDAQTLETIRRQMGFDQPVIVQYLTYITGIFTGREIMGVQCDAPCLGYSYVNRLPVTDLLLDRLPASLSLISGSVVLFLGFSLIAGSVAALKQGTLIDRGITGLAVTGDSLQNYFVGAVAIYFFVDIWQIMDRPAYTSPFEDPVTWFSGMILPWIVLSFLYTARYTRFTRSSLIDTLNEDYVRTVRAKGMPRRTLLVKHAGRGALTPIVTLFGLDLGVLLGGAPITETVFNIHGIGQLALNAVLDKDLPVIMGSIMIAATAMIVMAVIVDIAYAAIDPRVRVT